ncbi:MAG TPA: sulfatase-like hydrolase/transferase [Candidatus Krumholzibacteria bacterium]|nr:sulfatase-like hydrolase/transferase [Candidatus Krumholzibacteria bacterium]
MTATSSGRSLHAWLAARTDAYARAILVLGLNIPFLFFALGRYLGGISPTSIEGVYALLVVLGYYVLAIEIVISLLFLVLGFVPRVSLTITGVLLGAWLGYLAIDGIVYHLYRFHIDAFWITYLIGSIGDIGLSPVMIWTGIGLLVAAGVVEWLLVRLSRHLPARRRWALGLTVVAVIAYCASQAIHVLGYERNDTRITQITPRLPFYFPIVSHRDAVKYAHVLPALSEERAVETNDTQSLAYPLHEKRWRVPSGGRRPNIVLILLESWRFDTMNQRVSPEMYDLSQRSSVFLNHFSSGNSTPSGVFGLFYGIHPTYWTAVKANSAAIDNPVLIDVLQDNGYAFGVFADSHFERHKIKDAMFNGIEVHEKFAGNTPDARDADMTRRMIAFISQQQAVNRPFFAFAFYKSTHFNYYYPKDDVPFQPAYKMNLAMTAVGGHENRKAFFNDYLNSVHYTDELVGQVIKSLENSGLLKNTIVVVTSDHGEEFDDNHADYWGHTGNFTGYQTRVPMFIYVPWRDHREVKATTTHIDLPPTLLEEGLGYPEPVRNYSNGLDMFGPLPAQRPVVVSSYVNHAIISGDNVYVVYPMYVQKYRLWDIKGEASTMAPDVMREVMDEMACFYRNESTAAR